jgi:hypothetical protein
MNPNDYSTPPNQYSNPYSPTPEPARPVPNPDAFQPPQSPYNNGSGYNAQPPQTQAAPQYNQFSQQQASPYAPQPQQQPPMAQNPYAAPNPGMNPTMQQAPLQPMQSPMMGYNPYPYPDEFTATKKGPNKLILGIIAIVVIVGSIFGFLAFNGDNSDNNGNTGDNTQNQGTTNNNSADASKDIAPRTDGKLDLSSKINPSETLKPQNLQGNMDEQVNLSSGFSFMATDATSYTSTDGNVTPSAGKQFIVITVVIGNRTENTTFSVSNSDFRLRGQDNTMTAPSVVTSQITNNTLSNPNELKSGQQITGKIIFEVPSTQSSWALQHIETYQKTTDNTTFDVKGEVGIVLSRSTTSNSTNNSTQSQGTTSGQ